MGHGSEARERQGHGKERGGDFRATWEEEEMGNGRENETLERVSGKQGGEKHATSLTLARTHFPLSI